MIDKTPDILLCQDADQAEPQPTPLIPLADSCKILHPDTHKPAENYLGVLDYQTGILTRFTK